MMLEATPQHRGILFVCTGNVCRSPYAERRLRQLLPDADVPIGSAGTGALVGSGIEAEASAELSRLGADISDFSSRALSPALLKGADLVLTMTRAHRGEVARLHPASMRRTYALGDFADLCRASQAWRPIAPTRPWLPQVAAEAAAARGTVPPRDVTEIDVVDPYGRSARTHTEAFDRIEGFLAVVVAVLGSVAGSSRAASRS
jgi:protein-tyrosine phosphatase